MKNDVLTLLRDAGRLAFYSFIVGPALLLYALAMLIVLNGSPSQQFLNTARLLTDGAPEGKVMQCVLVEPSRKVVSPIQRDTDMPVVPDMPPHFSLCHMTPVDSQFWTRPADSILVASWLTAALCGAGVCFMKLSRSRKTDFSPDIRSVLHKKD